MPHTPLLSQPTYQSVDIVTTLRAEKDGYACPSSCRDEPCQESAFHPCSIDIYLALPRDAPPDFAPKHVPDTTMARPVRVSRIVSNAHAFAPIHGCCPRGDTRAGDKQIRSSRTEGLPNAQHHRSPAQLSMNHPSPPPSWQEACFLLPVTRHVYT